VKPVAWLSDEGDEAQDPPLNSAWVISFTFLLLRASSASSSLKSVLGIVRKLLVMSRTPHSTVGFSEFDKYYVLIS